MHGQALNSYTGELFKVGQGHDAKPLTALEVIDAVDKRWPGKLDALVDNYGSLERHDCLVRNLPVKVLQGLTFDQICKARYSQDIMMNSGVEDLFKESPNHHLLFKIQNSMWRWGMGNDCWNSVVDAYNGIRNFDLSLPNFEVRLDYTTGCNPRGYSEDARIFLDGVFGFLVYYKGEHVMTLGFSLARDNRIIVAQVQLAQRKGNRFLFKLPANRMEFVLSCFERAFPNSRLCVANGGDVVKTSLDSYKRVLEGIKDRKERDRSWPEDAAQAVLFKEKIKHLKAELPRLAVFYANTGRFSLGQVARMNDIGFYEVVNEPLAMAA